METIFTYLEMSSDKVLPYLSEISLAIVATLLAIYGDFLNKKVKKIIKDKPFLIRYLSFILICTFGYGFLTLYFANTLSNLMLQIPRKYLLLSIVTGFIFLGFLAERKNQI